MGFIEETVTFFFNIMLHEPTNKWRSKQNLVAKKVSIFFQEYPTHLIALKDETRMAAFLADWEIFDLLYNDDYSSKLLYLWRTVCTESWWNQPQIWLQSVPFFSIKIIHVYDIFEYNMAGTYAWYYIKCVQGTLGSIT